MSSNELCYLKFTAAEVQEQHQELNVSEVESRLKGLQDKNFIEKDGDKYNFTENGGERMYYILLLKYHSGGNKRMSLQYII